MLSSFNSLSKCWQLEVHPQAFTQLCLSEYRNVDIIFTVSCTVLTLRRCAEILSFLILTFNIILSYMEIKGQLDGTDWFLLQNLLFTQHVSGTIMPIIRSSRFIQMVAACGTWRFGLQVVGLVWSCGLCVRFVGYFSTGRLIA
jgi:hypothetical protein